MALKVGSLLLARSLWLHLKQLVACTVDVGAVTLVWPQGYRFFHKFLLYTEVLDNRASLRSTLGVCHRTQAGPRFLFGSGALELIQRAAASSRALASTLLDKNNGVAQKERSCSKLCFLK